MNDVVSGQIHMIFLGPSILAPFLKDGRVRAIASTGTRRIAAYPDVPTIAESGYPDYDIVSWIGLFVLKSTSPDTVMRLAQGVRAILSRPAFREVIAKNNLDVMGLTGDDAQHLLEQEERRWAEVIKANRIRVE